MLMVLPERIELSASPLPRECSTPELRQRRCGAPFTPPGAKRKRFCAGVVHWLALDGKGAAGYQLDPWQKANRTAANPPPGTNG